MGSGLTVKFSIRRTQTGSFSSPWVKKASFGISHGREQAQKSITSSFIYEIPFHESLFEDRREGCQ